jgi:thioredoxin-related protein
LPGLNPVAHAGDKNKKAPVKTAAEADDKEIHWLTWEEAQVKMKHVPKKVWVDVYTDWCIWCKRMDASTFKNASVIKYMNDNFYCIRFNAEKDDNINYLGTVYKLSPQYRGTSELAVKLMNGQLSYPTGIFMEEGFQNPQPIPGYHPVNEMELILTYLGNNVYRSQKFEDYQKTFKPSWPDNGPKVQMQGH